MPEEQAPDAEAQDTPDAQASGPESDTGTPAESNDDSPQFDPEKYVEKDRYENLRQEFDRRNPGYQLIDALRSEETRDQTFRELAEELGYTLEELEDELEDEDDEQEFRDPRVDELLSEREQLQREAELDQLEDHVESEIDRLAKDADVELSDDEVDLIFSALTPGEDGPDVERAFKRVIGIRDSAVKGVFASKRNAPQVPAGSSASHTPDLDDREQRREYLAQRLQDA